MSITQASWNGEVIAASDMCILVEGNTYFPPDSVDMRFFKPSAHTSVCGWKGTAGYFDVVVHGDTNSNAARVYDAPKAAAAPLARDLAFWKGVDVTGLQFAKAMK